MQMAGGGERVLQLEPLFLDGGDLQPQVLFHQIEASLERGNQVWVSAPLLEPLAESLGRARDGQRWLVLEPHPGSAPAWLFRVRDVLVAAIALAVLSPILGCIALLVRLSSPGPVFYATEVVGRGHRRFTWRKFRSMRLLNHDEDERQRKAEIRRFIEQTRGGARHSGDTDFKVVDACRVTPVGRVLRRYSLDELPQLLNVLKGQMTLVGPRPCLPYEVEFYPLWARRRFDVTPGLTGVWQVYGRGRVGFDESMAMDKYYIHRRSFAFDAYLMLKTVAVVFTGKGAL